MRRWILPPLLLGFGCDGCQTDTEEDWLEPILAEDPVSIEIGEAAGPSPLSVPVRGLNAYGIPVGASIVGVEVDGSGLQYGSPVILDGRGYGTLVVESETPQALQVSATSSDDGAAPGAPASAWITDGEPIDLGLQTAHALPVEPISVLPAWRGVALQTTYEIWWVGAEPGARPQLVADLENPILGAWSTHMEPDGIRDLVVWTAEEVFALRGHVDGGYTWGAGFASRNEIRWVSYGDFDSNGLTDLILIWNDNGTNGFRILEGDGVWGFTPQDPVEVSLELDAAAIGDFTGPGDPSVALQAGGTIRRYEVIDGRWTTVGSDDEYTLEGGSKLLPAADVDGDGYDDYVLIGPKTEGDRALLLVDNGDNGLRYPLSYPAYRISVGDLDGDGADDMVLAEGGDAPIVGILKSDGEGGYVHRSGPEIDGAGPVAVGDFDGDGYGDVAVFYDDLEILRGEEDEEGAWSERRTDATVWSLSREGPILGLYVDEDTVPEVLMLRVNNDGEARLELRGFDGSTEPPALQVLSSVSVDDAVEGVAAQGLDLVTCGATVWALVEDGSARYVWAAEIIDGELEPLASAEVEGDHLACGAFATGGDAVTATAEGLVTWLELSSTDTGLGGEWSLTAIDQQEVGALGDVAAGDVDGAGIALHTCPDADCTIDAVDLDGDGLDELLIGGAVGEISGVGEYDPAGRFTGTVDLGGDGIPDVVFTDPDTRRLRGVPTIDGGGPLMGWSLRREIEGPLLIGDVDGDGEAEAFAAGPDGTFVLISLE